ncbi:tRNA (adenine(22)-N(1))-methyltransferase [Neorhodopirellula pilleata]|uniref:tRNA (Adenine(22)-N(1))-methyltransferase n=1 Tax=Neorhodopirellula pilleata TaxID=2714738 RepID=A0A5C6AG99_9BACT|nr:class I SAM-dependent methyltransferase [Neorhodopirellula pilleata]TWT99004.1 tRNA (adenine(22)-N(1))-methyltransferase [Neorhodopirellula pilleata]
MPRLDPRLRFVAGRIRSQVHADIGSDHGHLLAALLATGRVVRGIAIENKPTPLANSRVALARYACDVRSGDGLEPLQPGEADSLSVCGMGGRSMVEILTRFPDRVPDHVVLQPNQRSDLIRRWGLASGFHLIDEHWVGDHRLFEVLEFSRAAADVLSHDDPAYEGLDRSAAVLLGPHHLRRRETKFVERLCEERAYYQGLQVLTPASRERLDAIERSI